MSSLQRDIEARLAETAPDVEVLLAEVLGGHTVRLFIDHPDGVSVALCERVTHLLPEVRERYALEVSSPGGTRPLTKPAHFRRFLGRRARVRLRDARTATRPSRVSWSARPRRRSRSPSTPRLIAIPYADIRKSNLVEE